MSSSPTTAVATARHELGLEFVDDLRRIDEQMRETRARIAAVVAASKTTLTEIYRGRARSSPPRSSATSATSRALPSSDRFAAYNGTAPIEVSSGPRKIYRLSRRGNRRLNHAIHMAAVTQIRNRHSEGRAYYDRKIAEGKTGKEALRALKRRISDAIFAHLQADARRAADARGKVGPGGQPGNDSVASVAGSHPEHRLFGQATPEPAISLRRPPRRSPGAQPGPAIKKARRVS